MEHELITGTKKIRQASLRLGFCTLQFGVFTDNATAGENSVGLIFKVTGREPKQAGGLFNVIYLGLRATRYGNRMRLGFTKRNQTIQKV